MTSTHSRLVGEEWVKMDGTAPDRLRSLATPLLDGERWSYPAAVTVMPAGRALHDAADEIERLRSVRDGLVAALERMHAAFNAKQPIPTEEGTALEAMCRAALSAAKGES